MVPGGIDRKLASRMFISQRISIHGSKPNKYFDRPPSVRYKIIAKGGRAAVGLVQDKIFDPMSLSASHGPGAALQASLGSQVIS